MKPERVRRTDKFGESFEIGIGCAEDFAPVLEMYSIFSPKPASQGLPPQDPETCQNWLKTLFEIGVNGISWRDDSVIGHAAMIPDAKVKSGEFVVFVHQDHRNLRIGTELARFTLEKFGQLGFEVAWLTVRVSNFIAVKLYRKLGFEYCDKDSYERVMAVELDSFMH
jgi:GNAT superfamily N-acetyltransferase